MNKRISRKISGMVLAGALAIGATAATTTPAAATEGWERCPENMLCLFGDTNYNGLLMVFPDIPLLHHQWNDTTTSYWNRTNETWRLYTDHDGTGICIPVPPGHPTPNIGPYLNDTVSSVGLGDC
ncbi:peptidase inhibitor family I36 protein [Streptomyces sp. NPDC001514]